MNNSNKFKLPHIQKKLKQSGAIGTINSPIKTTNRKLIGEITNILDLNELTGLEIKLQNGETKPFTTNISRFNFGIGGYLHLTQRTRTYSDGSKDVTEKLFDEYIELDETVFIKYNKSGYTSFEKRFSL